ncbi:MAG: hypothetical protein AMXMBFR13_50920 [Phycisphaerae bacterium]
MRTTFMPDSGQAAALKEQLSYDLRDLERVWSIATLLTPGEATEFLKAYTKEYIQRNRIPDRTWGRAVYCLALAQTPEARDYLLSIWDEYDGLLAANKFPVSLVQLHLYIDPLEVVGDTLHFYLREPDVRTWFMDRIAEGEKMPKLSLGENMNELKRKAARLQLIVSIR